MKGNIRIASDSALVNGHTTVTVDGIRVKGITKIELVAERNDLWRAVIYCIPEQIDVTDIDSLAIETAQLRPPAPVHVVPEYGDSGDNAERRNALNVDGSPMEDSPDA